MPYKTPIYTALREYTQEGVLRLHMPGHIGRHLAAAEMQALASIDVTEVPGLDDLHLPGEVIEQSRCLLARAFGAHKSFFLVNGATSGIQALFMGLTAAGEKVLVPRNAHRSFFEGLVLSGAMPVYIPVQTLEDPGVALAVNPKELEALLEPSLKTVFLTSPSYYGTTCYLEEIAAKVHSQGKQLLVDEAHGAHFSFSSSFPVSALKSGADAAVNGLHKTLPVLNQGAVLHLAASLSDNERIAASLSLLTTTSPSYPIMASIELARALMEEKGEALLTQALEYAAAFRAQVRKLKGLKYYYEELKQVPGVQDLDPLKVLIGTGDTGLTGWQLSQWLREKYKIQVEIADERYILALFSIFHQKTDWERLYRALEEISTRAAGTDPGQTVKVPLPPDPNVTLSPRAAFLAPHTRLPLAACRGKIAGEMVAAYPPGIPCLLPGEMITDTVLDYLAYLKATGARLQGPQDSSLQELMILDV